jgi:hypothetical protein
MQQEIQKSKQVRVFKILTEIRPVVFITHKINWGWDGVNLDL